MRIPSDSALARDTLLIRIIAADAELSQRFKSRNIALNGAV